MNTILQQAFVSKTKKPVATDDNMIHHVNPYNFSGFIKPVSDFKVLLAGSGVSAWVIMD